MIEGLKTRFNKHISKQEKCWEWIAHLDHKGYGTIFFNGKKMLAHRASWLIHQGDIPNKLLVCHKCDNPKCVNPEHLFLGTHKDNLHDAIKKGRYKGNFFINNAKLTVDMVSQIKDMLKNKHLCCREIAEKFNVSRTAISEIKHGRNWRFV